MDVDVHALRCFVAVVDHGTATAAARHLGLGQPAVSRQVQHLERRLRVTLFHRQDGRLHLTAAGAELLAASRAAVEATDHVTRVAGRVADGALQYVRIASTRTTLDDVIAPWIATWARSWPMPLVQEAAAAAVYDGLRTGTDLGIGPLPASKDFRQLVLCDLPLTAQVGPEHPWVDRRDVSLEELLEVPLVLLGPASHARQTFDQALARHGLHCTPSAEPSTPASAQAIAASGRGVAVVTDDPRFGLTTLPVRDPDGDLVSVRLRAVWEPSHHGSASLERLSRNLRAFIERRYNLQPL